MVRPIFLIVNDVQIGSGNENKLCYFIKPVYDRVNISNILMVFNGKMMYKYNDRVAVIYTGR